jgi:transcription antitermination protein NusB
MLSRRNLRIRVMQALYAWHQSDHKSPLMAENELLHGTEKMHELYLKLLAFFTELSHQEELYYTDHPASALTGIKRSAAHTISQNLFIRWLASDAAFTKLTGEKKISWQQDQEVVKKAFYELRKMPFYKEYITSSLKTPEQDIEFAKKVVGEIISSKEFVRHVLEEKNIYWAEGFDVITAMVIRTIESGFQKQGFILTRLYKDEEEDLQFMKDLLRKTIENDEYFTGLIAERTESWDTDRIALVDILLMKMALCEIIYLSNIPVKVSINEYIDISKDYSTPNSKGFINGVIDNIVIALKKEGKIVKTGRGLLE